MSAPDLNDTQFAALMQPRFEALTTFDAAAPEVLAPLLADLRFGWDGAESGAPMVDPGAPLVRGAVWDRVATQIGTSELDRVISAWLSMSGLMRLAGLFGQVEPGTYTLRNVDADWIMQAMAGYSGMTLARAGITADGQVRLSPDQISLIRNQYWEWTHFELAEEILLDTLWPGPSADPKRPYGDMSFYANDVHRILDWPIESRDADGWIQISPAQERAADDLHFTMLAATQVFFENVTLDTGSDDVVAVVEQWAESAQ